MISILLDAALSLELFIFAIVAHEIGHMLSFRAYGIKPKLQFKRTEKGFKFIFNIPEAYQSLNDAHKCMIYMLGVGFGWSFLIYSHIIFDMPIFLTVFWGIIYFYGCKTDVTNFIKCWKRMD